MIPAIVDDENSRIINAAGEARLCVRGGRLQRIDVARSKGSTALGCKDLNLLLS
jgi:hypothetical protein